MPDHFAEVALPLATRASFRVAQAVSVERTRTVIAADELARLLADATLVLVAVCTSLLLAHLICVSLAIGVRDDGAACTVEKTLLEHVEALHVHLFEDEFRVVPLLDFHHVLVRDRYRHRSAGSAHELRDIEMPAEVLVDDVLVEKAQVKHRLVVFTQLLELLKLLVMRPETRHLTALYRLRRRGNLLVHG